MKNLKTLFAAVLLIIVYTSCETNNENSNASGVEITTGSAALDYFYFNIGAENYKGLDMFFKGETDQKSTLIESQKTQRNMLGNYKNYELVNKEKKKSSKQTLHTFYLKVNYEKQSLFTKISFVEEESKSNHNFFVNSYNQYNSKEEMLQE